MKLFKNMEKGVGFKNIFGDFVRDVSFKSIMNGLLGGVFTYSYLLFFWAILPSYGLDSSVMDRWITTTLYLGGMGGILLAAYFRKPVGMAGSLPSFLIAIGLATIYTEGELSAACLVSGILLVFLAMSGLMKKVLLLLPTPVVMGMTSGCFMSYGLFIIKPVNEAPIIVLLMVASYLILKKYSRKIPGVLGAIVVAIVYFVTLGIDLPVIQIIARFPQLSPPVFNGNFLKVFMSLSIPMTALILGAENAQAYGVLEAEEYDPPINGMTFASGLGGIFSALLGTINLNIAGPLTAISASPDSGKKEGRWTAMVVCHLCWLVAAPFYASLVGFMTKFPAAFVQLVAGLSVLPVLLGSLKSTFADSRHLVSAGFALLIGISGIKILGMTAPFWSLVVGVLIYILFEDGLKKEKPVAGVHLAEEV